MRIKFWVLSWLNVNSQDGTASENPHALNEGVCFAYSPQQISIPKVTFWTNYTYPWMNITRQTMCTYQGRMYACFHGLLYMILLEQYWMAWHLWEFGFMCLRHLCGHVWGRNPQWVCPNKCHIMGIIPTAQFLRFQAMNSLKSAKVLFSLNQ